MTRESGIYIRGGSEHEPFFSFVPHPLPPTKPPLSSQSYELNETALLALAELSGMTGLVASTDWLIYSAMRKEALLTSQMEGTQATISDLFDEEAGLEVDANDVSDITGYISAFNIARTNLNSDSGLPICMRLLSLAHKELLSGKRGEEKMPGEIRTSQNWIGGSRPGNALYVPPPADQLPNLTKKLEEFINSTDTTSSLPILVRIALTHAQFETIHPYLDGNGRIGRLLIALQLESAGLLKEPLLYVSGYLKENQQIYYNHLTKIRTDGDFESWVSFFLKAVIESSKKAKNNIVNIAALIASDRKKIISDEKTSMAAVRLLELLPTMPRLTIEKAAESLGITFPTADKAIKKLIEHQVLHEVTGKKRFKSFTYKSYVDIMKS